MSGGATFDSVVVSAAPLGRGEERETARMSVSWRNLIAVHPAAKLLPMFDDAHLGQLVADIATQGMRVPISLWRADESAPWQLIDGRNRLEALARLDKAHERVEKAIEWATRYEGSEVDPWSFCISANIHRRHLTLKQRRDLIAQLLKQDPTRSNRAVATTVGVDHKTVSSVRDKAEARGEIPHVVQRVDTKGRSQPATKQAARPVAVARPTAPAKLTPLVSRAYRAISRDQAVVSLSALFRQNIRRGLEDVISILRDEKQRVAQTSLENRQALAAAFLAALDVDPRSLAEGAGRHEAAR